MLDWALQWGADVIIAQFDDDDDVSIFKEHGIVAIAQDYRHRFSQIPNITGDYIATGEMAADLFISKGFRNFAFFGYNEVCWSDERCRGFWKRLETFGMGHFFAEYDGQNIDNLWYYESVGLKQWLLELPKPVAIMACDDNQANILLEACNSCGLKLPDEVAVIGVDNDEILCNLSNPTLSSIDVDIARGGYEAAKMAMRMLRDKNYMGEDIVLKPVGIVNRLSTSVFATQDKQVLKALLFIHQNIDKKINVNDVLEVVPLSRRLLEMRFKKEVGETIYTYISRARIDRFAQLLLTTNDSVTDIVISMDEEDSKSISRRFKELRGMTPSKFREKEARKK